MNQNFIKSFKTLLKPLLRLLNIHATGAQRPKYLIVGSGRLAKHLAHYFSLVGISYQVWSRKQSPQALHELLQNKPTVLLAISDDALEKFFNQHLLGKNLKTIHFSGALHLNQMISCHPLMTFGTDLFDISVYRKIFFAVTGIKNLQEIFPQLPNSSFALDPEQKPLYHAICVLSAAGAQKIWSQSESMLQNLGIPKEAFRPYVKQIADNYLLAGPHALTGPWARHDEKTIERNLKALSTNSKALHQVYDILKEGNL